MNATTSLLTACVLLTLSSAVQSGIVDLSPGRSGDRIAVFEGVKVSYLPAKRVDLGKKASGGGICRYIHCAPNGDLYIMGTGFKAVLGSQDGGHTWTSAPVEFDSVGFILAFAILRDGTFVVATTRSAGMRVARSTDRGKRWIGGGYRSRSDAAQTDVGWNLDMLDLGKTWAKGSYIIGQGTEEFDTAVLSLQRCQGRWRSNHGVCQPLGYDVTRLEAVHWRLQPKQEIH